MAQPEKRENSVLFSLRELRQIEENRVQEEEQAHRSAEESRRMAAEDAERRRREAEEAKVRAERDALLEIERTRENAERAARMRVESAEAAERQRQQAALEQQRLHQEMELRRAEVAKTRPTWMVAVTIGALVVTVALVFLAIRAFRSEDTANEDKEKAQLLAREGCVWCPDWLGARVLPSGGRGYSFILELEDFTVKIADPPKVKAAVEAPPK